MKFVIINGPNLNMLGIREPNIYGHLGYGDLEAFCAEEGRKCGVEIECFQSNSEGAIVDHIQRCFGRADGIIINPAAYTHTSIAILDALKSVGLPAVEVHLSDVDSREDFRKLSYAGMACFARFAGYGFEGYAMAVKALAEEVKIRKEAAAAVYGVQI